MVWGLLLREIARSDLRLVVTHPDGLGGVAFIGQYPNAFTALVLAMSCVLGAAIANAFLHDALTLTAYGYVMTAWLVVVLAIFGIPLFAFMRPLGQLKRQALLAATAAATRHFRAAERAALGTNISAASDSDDAAVGDIPNPSATYAAAKKLRTMPFSREALVPVAAAAILPLVLAGSTRLPFAELWKIARKLLLL
jgi:type II secretory pathway pseudopilin PulG